MITKELLKGYTEEEYIQAILNLTKSNVKARGISVQIKQLEDILEYLEENSLVENISDKDDKRFDRLKKMLEDLDVYIQKIDNQQQVLMDLEPKEDNSKKKKNRDILSFINDGVVQKD